MKNLSATPAESKTDSILEAAPSMHFHLKAMLNAINDLRKLRLLTPAEIDAHDKIEAALIAIEVMTGHE